MAVMELPDYRKLYEAQCKETESWRTAAELFRETLRDQFAMSVMQGLLASIQLSSILQKEGADEDAPIRVLAAKSAYQFADEMLEARKAR